MLTSLGRRGSGLGDSCGDYPAASGFGSFTIDANGSKIQQPLNAVQNAAYLAAASTYNACKMAAVGAPSCPPGSSFQGGNAGGVWAGSCVSTYTGKATTDYTVAPISVVAATGTPVTSTAARTTVATPVSSTPATVAITPVVTADTNTGRPRATVLPTPTPTSSTTGTTTPVVSVTAAPSSASTPVSISNVAAALGIDPAAIQNDTTGAWNQFYAYLNQQSINAGTASASAIQAAYAAFNGGVSSVVSSALSSPVILLALAAGAFFLLKK